MKLTSKTINTHLSKGGKIRRTVWQKDLFLKKVTPLADVSALVNNKGQLWVPGMNQLQATDWEKIKDDSQTD